MNGAPDRSIVGYPQIHREIEYCQGFTKVSLDVIGRSGRVSRIAAIDRLEPAYALSSVRVVVGETDAHCLRIKLEQPTIPNCLPPDVPPKHTGPPNQRRKQYRGSGPRPVGYRRAKCNQKHQQLERKEVQQIVVMAASQKVRKGGIG